MSLQRGRNKTLGFENMRSLSKLFKSLKSNWENDMLREHNGKRETKPWHFDIIKRRYDIIGCVNVDIWD